MTIKFSLRKGMKPDAILNELNGKVSGETRQLYQAFREPAKRHATILGDPLHKVIGTGTANGQKYAIIEKINTHSSLDRVYTKSIEDGKQYEVGKVKSIKTDRSYFLSGINDEGTYFVHPMDAECIKIYWSTGNMQNVLNRINRTAEGFSRIQGDVLFKEYDDYELVRGDADDDGIEDITLDENNMHMNLISRDMSEMRVRQELENDRAGRGFSRWSIPSMDGNNSRKAYVDGIEKIFDLNTGHEIDMDEEQKKNIKRFTATDMTKEEYEEEYVKHMNTRTITYGAMKGKSDTLSNPLPLFGNHFLYTDAKKIYSGSQGVLLLEPTVIALEHNEHKSVKFNPTKGKHVYLTTQRGVTAVEGKFVGYD